VVYSLLINSIIKFLAIYLWFYHYFLMDFFMLFSKKYSKNIISNHYKWLEFKVLLVWYIVLLSYRL
jgi:hypothetical protein